MTLFDGYIHLTDEEMADFSDWQRFSPDGQFAASLAYAILWPLRILNIGRSSIWLSTIQHGPVHCRIDDNGVQLTMNEFTGSWSWRKIKGIAETSQLMIIDITTDRKIAIPKRELTPVDRMPLRFNPVQYATPSKFRHS